MPNTLEKRAFPSWALAVIPGLPGDIPHSHELRQKLTADGWRVADCTSLGTEDVEALLEKPGALMLLNFPRTLEEAQMLVSHPAKWLIGSFKTAGTLLQQGIADKLNSDNGLCSLNGGKPLQVTYGQLHHRLDMARKLYEKDANLHEKKGRAERAA